MTTVRQRTGLLCVVVALAACSGDKADPTWPHAGDPCGQERLGYKTCGLTSSGDEAVLHCQQVGVEALWVAEETCPHGCEKALCVGTGMLQDAAGDGTGRVPEETRDGGTEVLPDLPERGADGGCEPGHTTCLGPTTQGICRADGSGYEPQPCAPDEGCEAGYCTARSCTPGEPKGECFSATDYLACNEAGTNWEAVSCTAPLTCYQGDCVDWGCPPGERLCQGLTAVQECIETAPGTWDFVVVETCTSGLCQDGECVSACEANVKLNTYLGCNYWAVDLDNIEGGQLEVVGLVVSAPATGEDALLTITNTATGQALTAADLGGASLTIPAGSLAVYHLPTFFDLDGSVHTNRSFRIESSQPVTVHQFNPLVGENVFTNDASLLLPDNVGGTEYLVMSWPLRTWAATLRGFATVVATQPGTTAVTVTATANVSAGTGVPAMVTGQTQNFNLSQGEVLNLEVAGSEGADLTGTRILADQPVNVFGGHECANIHLDYERCDHIEQQLFPLSAWGMTYAGAPFHPRTDGHVDTWRVLAGDNNITVTLDPPVAGPFALAKGQWAEFDTAEPFVATGTGRFLLGHYLQSCNYPGYEVFCSDTAGQLGIGDPAFTLAVPVVQYLDSYIFLTPEGYAEDYVNIVALPDTSVTLDGVPLDTSWAPLGDGSLVMTQHPVGPGAHTLEADKPVGLTVYGYGCHVSYAYPGGLSLEEVN